MDSGVGHGRQRATNPVCARELAEDCRHLYRYSMRLVRPSPNPCVVAKQCAKPSALPPDFDEMSREDTDRNDSHAGAVATKTHRLAEGLLSQLCPREEALWRARWFLRVPTHQTLRQRRRPREASESRCALGPCEFAGRTKSSASFGGRERPQDSTGHSGPGWKLGLRVHVAPGTGAGRASFRRV